MDPFEEYLNDLGGKFVKGEVEHMARMAGTLTEKPLNAVEIETIGSSAFMLFKALQDKQHLSSQKSTVLVGLIKTVRKYNLATEVGERFKKGFGTTSNVKAERLED
ncbi:uncharacterized protein LOC144447933 [Glandiceps talaboti]